MDYKEKYEKALEFATAIYRDGNYTVLKTITTTFPELEDIRNEKIRSALIRLVKQSTEELDESTQEEMLDWLDAQNKKKTDPRYKYFEDLIAADDIHQMSMNDEMVKEAKDKAIAALSKIGVCELLGFEKQCEQDSPVDINKMVDEFAHAESKGYGVPSIIEVDAYRKGIEDALEKQGERKPVSITDEWIEDYWQHEKVINFDTYDKGEEIQFDHYGFVNFCKRYCKKPVERNEEDESIRKELITHFRNTRCVTEEGAEKIAQWVAWLENQGEQKTDDKTEPKFKPGDTMRTWREAANGYTDGMPVVVSIDNEYYHCTNELIAIKDQDNYEFPPINVKQKSSDKVEPKFHEGDWIIRNNKYTGVPVQVIGFKGYYECDLNGEMITLTLNDVHNNFRLWAIADAKDGDVLYLQHEGVEHVIMYKRLVKKNFHTILSVHCAYDGSTNDFFEDCDSYHCITSERDEKEIHPATKEQRDLLFQKMADAGYEWDSEKKELKKAELKFHEGDWVVCEVTGSAYQIKNCSEIPNNHKFGYDLTNGGYIGSDEVNLYHLWTIQDAKDGDVVVDKSDGTIGIFQSIGHHPAGGSYNDPSYCFLHCRYDDGFFYADFEYGNTIVSDDLIPATKEQRDLLFAKMKEAGYEWNGKKKELNKIKPKTLDADKVIAWLRQHSCAACWDNSDEGVSQRIEQFKKDFEI